MDPTQRRYERVRNQKLREEAARKLRDERNKIEQERSKQRSIAAKKAAETKKKLNLHTIKSSKRVLKLKYGTSLKPPPFIDLNLDVDQTALFWAKANLREFLLRFDKICRLPTKLNSGLNDLLRPWVPEQLKPIAIALLKLIQNDKRPLYNVSSLITQVEQLEPQDLKIWDLLFKFMEQIEPLTPLTPPESEFEKIDLLRLLAVVCTSTESVRLTVMSDVDQLKFVEKDSQEEIKQIQLKFKQTQSKLLKLKQVDKEVYADRLGQAQRSTANKVFKVQQQLWIKLHKYTMRTSPVYTDMLGNRYWALQYKSPTQPAWGSWILCELVYDLTQVCQWFDTFSEDINKVVKKRDQLLKEKADERKKKKQEQSDQPQLSLKLHLAAPLPNVVMPIESVPQIPDIMQPVNVQESQPRRKYPKLKTNFPQRLPVPKLCYVEGKENIQTLSRFVAGLSKSTQKSIPEIDELAEYLA